MKIFYPETLLATLYFSSTTSLETLWKSFT